MTKLTVPIDSGVIFNLKVHFAEEFKIDVKNQVIKAIDEKCHLGKKRIEEALNKSFKQVKMDPSSGYIKCLLFYDTNVQKYFVRALQEQMKKHGCDYLDFYDIDDNKISFKDAENIGFVKSVTELSKKMAGYNFNFPSSSDLKIRSYKNAMSWLIFSLTRLPICGYYYDEFVDKGRISSGDRFAFIPMVKEGNISRYLTYMEADKINTKFSHDILTDVKGQTEATSKDEFIRSGVDRMYAFSDRQIALLISVIIENSVINKDGQIEIDPGLRFRALSRSPSTELSDTKWESPVRSRGEGLERPPRQWSEREEETGRLSQLVLEEIDPSQSTCDQSQLSLGAGKGMLTEANIRDQKMTCRSSSIPFPIAWDNSISLNFGVSEDPPKDTENICNEEPEKQQVTDKSDRKSSDECSEAKSQDSKSPKKHRGGWFCSANSNGGTLLEKISATFRRNNKGRNSVCSISSSVSAPGGPVTEKLPLSKRHASERRAKSSGELHLPVEHRAQLPDNSSSKKVDRDSGFCSMGSPAVSHKGSVPSKVKECSTQRVKAHSVEHT
ncbi:hypothetical protein [Wolbachia endosymbiont (group A) of Bombylius major]|uniref:hypothetical protein n=1 Tax=Wolbachia endosymbiont (group A) of Bombylius major TaxID=2953988 RepID=UPI0022300853|nr:hypothetical protein [Wolbachia endosymbiont (group A) of Bombylius major]